MMVALMCSIFRLYGLGSGRLRHRFVLAVIVNEKRARGTRYLSEIY